MTAESPVVLVRVDRTPERHTLHPRHLHAPLDLLYVQAGLTARHGLAARLVDHWISPSSIEALIERLLRLRPRVVLVRANAWADREAVAVGRALRARNIVSVAAGQLVGHALMRPVAGWNAAFDIALHGEPEEVAVDLLAALHDGDDAAAVATREAHRRSTGPHQVTAPDALPWPTQTPGQMRDYRFPFPLRGRPARRWGHVQTSWGCPSRCLHCTEVVRKSVGYHYRRRDPGAVAEEVARLAADGADAICFEDDSLLADRRHFLALCDALAHLKPKVRWLASVRPDDLDGEAIAAAAEAGAALFKVGVETGVPWLAERIGKTRDGETWRRHVIEVFDAIDGAGIGSVALFLVGLPGETPGDHRSTREFVRRLRPDYLQLQRFTHYPDVALPAGDASASREADYHYPPAVGSFDTLDAAQAGIYRDYYMSPGYVVRHLASKWRAYLDPHQLRASLLGMAGALRSVAGRNG